MSTRNQFREAFLPIQRGLERLRLFVGGPRRFFGMWEPSCYCHSCEMCAHRATWRFPFRFHNSCDTCLTCPGSEYLYAPWDSSHVPRPLPENWGSTARVKITTIYRIRSFVGGFLHYAVAVLIDPKDERDLPNSSSNVEPLQPAAHAGGNS